MAAEDVALLLLAALVLVLPLLSEGGGPGAAPGRSSFAVEPLGIDVDSAEWPEWALLEGIGEQRARRIVEFVRSRRPLRSLEELAEVPGLPAGWLERARPHLRLGSGSSAAGAPSAVPAAAAGDGPPPVGRDHPPFPEATPTGKGAPPCPAPSG